MKLLFAAIMLLQTCTQPTQNNAAMSVSQAPNLSQTTSSATDSIVLGGGCFWCVEAVYLQLDGVTKVISGYAGGKPKNPTYREVCSGLTGHAEVVKVVFEPEKISLAEILEIFWTAHDPTTLNKQGADAGTQYRSVIFYNNDAQKAAAEQSIKTVANTIWNDPIVTEISPLPTFYIAEDYHQNYFNLNSNQPYCQIVINPKIEKVRKKFASKLKK
jgi:peptide-methionine (S)-S-oxide reductase